MSDTDDRSSVRRLYWLTVSFGALGFVLYLAFIGWPFAVAFGLGALGSFGNLWLFERLSHSIAPADAPRKPWQASAFVLRYVILFFFAYVTIKGLGVNPLALVLGLLASTAAVLASQIFDLLKSLLASRSTH